MRMLKRNCLLLLLVLLSPWSIAENDGDVIALLQQNAEAGDWTAQTQLLNRYLSGDGVKKDINKAFYWQLKAAEHGRSADLFLVGIAYHKGEGTDIDMTKAVIWYEKAVAKNDAVAQGILGWTLYRGS